jgi:uncharacterized membrane protein YkvA (DUF1232 family)
MKDGNFLDFLNIAKGWRDLVSMIKDKDYKIPIFRKLTYLASIVYIIIPLDFIPGVFPIVGLVDDVGVLALLIGLVLYEISCYREFKESGVKDDGFGSSTDGSKVKEAAKRLNPPKTSGGDK